MVALLKIAEHWMKRITENRKDLDNRITENRKDLDERITENRGT